MTTTFSCPLPSFSIFTREICVWPHAHVLAPLTIYLHTRDPIFTILMTLSWEAIETWLLAFIGEGGEMSLQDAGSDTCLGAEELMDDALIGDLAMGIAGLLIGILIVWSTRAARFVSLRRRHVMLLEAIVELIPNLTYAYAVMGVNIMVYARPLAVIIVELLGWRYWHDDGGALRPIVLWIVIELVFVAMSFVPLGVGGSFYQNTFMSIGLAIFLCVCCYYMLRSEHRTERKPNAAIYGFHILCPDWKEMMPTKV